MAGAPTDATVLGTGDDVESVTPPVPNFESFANVEAGSCLDGRLVVVANWDEGS